MTQIKAADNGRKMQLSASDIDEIRKSFMMVSADQAHAGELFYKKLFEIAPETRDLFVNDMGEQAKKLMNTLSVVVSQLQTWPDLAPLLEDLALRHVAYGVKPEHYQSVGVALLAMMSEMLGEDFTDGMREAWLTAYSGITDHMIDAAYREDRI